MFTTMSWERNVASDGSPRVNINKAAVADLTGIGLSTNLANALIRFRTPTTTTGTTGTTGTTTTPTTPVKAKSLTRQAKAGPTTSTPSGNPTGTTTTGATGVTGGTFKSVGDLLSVPGFTQTVMQQVADQLSIDAQAYHADKININTASQEVLATIPGIDQTTLNAIVAYRQGGQYFQSLNDFFSLQGLTRVEFQNVVGSICTKSSFYRVRVRVRMSGQDVTALVQLTENGPQILQWKEVQRSPGWAYWAPSPILPTPTPPTLTHSSTSSSSGTSP
jgi:DNA uptake protein ComE-like DNA-binding protein